MAYEKQNWVPYDDNLSEEENINVGAVVTAERMNHIESGIQQHTTDEENPHKVTKSQVGLSNVTDVEQASKVDFEAHATNNQNPHGVTASQVGLNNVENIRQAAKTDFDAHVENNSNPHGVTKSQVGLGDVANYSIATEDEAKEGLADNKYMTPAKTKQAIESKTVMEVVNLVPLNGATFEQNKNLAIIRRENGVVYVELGLRLRLPARFVDGSAFASLGMPIPSKVVFKAASEASTAATCHVEINPDGNLIMWKPAAETALYHINAVAPSGLI